MLHFILTRAFVLIFGPVSAPVAPLVSDQPLINSSLYSISVLLSIYEGSLSVFLSLALLQSSGEKQLILTRKRLTVMRKMDLLYKGDQMNFFALFLLQIRVMEVYYFLHNLYLVQCKCSSVHSSKKKNPKRFNCNLLVTILSFTFDSPS